MKDFLKTKTFISMCIIAVLLLGMMAVSAASRGKVTIIEDIVGMLITPLQNLCTTISEKSGDFAAIFTEHDKLMAENEKLKNELAAALQSVRDAQSYKLENESLKGLLDIKTENPSYMFESALVVASDRSGYSHTLTLNRGSANGIEKRDLVITPDGLVGYVSELGTSWCKVTTLLDSSCEVGAIVSRTLDIGVMEGDYALAQEGKCKISYLSNEIVLNSGDSVITSGIGGVFPSRILIGNVLEIKPESHGISQYAVIEPAVDFSDLTHVFVITEFSDEAPEDTE